MFRPRGNAALLALTLVLTNPPAPAGAQAPSFQDLNAAATRRIDLEAEGARVLADRHPIFRAGAISGRLFATMQRVRDFSIDAQRDWLGRRLGGVILIQTAALESVDRFHGAALRGDRAAASSAVTDLRRNLQVLEGLLVEIGNQLGNDWEHRQMVRIVTATRGTVFLADGLASSLAS